MANITVTKEQLASSVSIVINGQVKIQAVSEDGSTTLAELLGACFDAGNLPANVVNQNSDGSYSLRDTVYVMGSDSSLRVVTKDGGVFVDAGERVILEVKHDNG